MKKQTVGVAIGVLAISGFVLGRLSMGASRPEGEDRPHHPPFALIARTGKGDQQAPGVRTETVRRNSESMVLRIAGKVTVDENRTYRVNAGTDGRVQSLGNNPPGTVVHKGEKLAAFFSNELIKAQLAYFFALQSLERDKAGGRPSLVRQSEESVLSNEEILCGMGMGEPQIRRLAQTRQATRDIEIPSPTDGLVVSRNLTPQQPLARGTELYRIVDLAKVWVLANVLPGEMATIGPGSTATVIARRTGRKLAATVSSAVPLFNAESRVLQLKLEVENRDLALLPDMPVDIEFRISADPGISVPAQAVIDSGLQKIVYVRGAEGSSEPRVVELGNRLGDRVLIRRGLSEDEQVLVEGNFLMDSESRLREGWLRAGAAH
jgi:Cu(I)/Ag(I) efflux system membrane fusion protein